MRGRAQRHRRWPGRPLAVGIALAAVASVTTAAAPRGLDDQGDAAATAARAGAVPSGGPPGGADPTAGAGTTGSGQNRPPPAATTPAAEPLARPTPRRTVDPLDEAAARARKITDTIEWASFTVMDRKRGRWAGDRRAAEPTNVESVVKAWLGADLLSETDDGKDPLPSWEWTLLTSMIRESDDDAAEVVWRSLGGDESIRRMIAVCGMTDTSVYPGRWAFTRISARDMARLGNCLVPGGRVLTARTGAELIGLMRTVAPSNAFGIQAAEPAGRGVRIAIKNGWTEHGGVAGGVWNVNCLGLWGPDLRWVLAVTTRYPLRLGLGYGADACRRVTGALFP